MAESSLAKKLKLNPSALAAIINAPEDYLGEFKHAHAISKKLSGKFEWI